MRPDAILYILIEKIAAGALPKCHNRKVRLGGFEPPTPALGEPRSIHLSYRRIFLIKNSRKCARFNLF